jgi:hypothetical protein
MTESSASNALKHGAFSEVLILPGEDPAAFEKLKQRLFAEFNVSGCSEELTMISIAKTMWQLQRLRVYEHVQFLRAQGSSSPYPGGLKSPVNEIIRNFRAKHGLIARDDSSAKAPTEEIPPKEKTTDELLLQLGDFVSLGHMDKELEVENKIMAKLDRLFRRYFQIKTMKSLMDERDVPAPALGGATPVLELTATDTSTAPDAPVHAPEFAGSATD